MFAILQTLSLLEGNHSLVSEDCNKVFCSHLGLCKHQKNHTGKKDHKCEKASTKLFNLTQHKVVLSVQKHYTSGYAGKFFTLLKSLKNINEQSSFSRETLQV